jgi:hypothetical protein
MGFGMRVLVVAAVLFFAGCEKERTRDTYYPPAAEIFAGETGRLVMPDDERLPVLLGRTVEDYDHGWMSYVNGWKDLFANLKKSGQVRWIPPKTPILVVMTENRLGQVYIFVRFHPDRKPVGKLLEDPHGWWTTARNFQIVTGTDGKPKVP